MSKTYDAVIIGGGHNGLVCGAYLARAGRSVCVLERRHLIGGAAVTEELWPGFKVSTASYTMALLQPRVILELELKKHGFEVLKPTPTFQPLDGGRQLTFYDDLVRTCAGIAAISPKDAEAYPRYRDYMSDLAKIVRRLLWEIPFDPASRRPADVLGMLRFALRYRDIGEQFYDVYDVMTLSAYDLLSRWFQSEEMKAALGFYAAGGGANGGMKTPGSAYVLMRAFIRDHETEAGGAGFVRGGMGMISNSIANSGRAHGMEIRTDAEVASIVIDNGRATGVVLKSGETVSGRTVIANASAQATFLKLIPSGELPADFVSEVRKIRDASTSFKVHFGLNRLPTFRHFDPAAQGFAYPAVLKVGPSVDYLEQAHDDSKYGRFSRRPVMTVMTPSVADSTLAPPGMHVMSIFAQHAPYALRGRTWDDARDDLYRTVLETLDEFSPDLRDCIVHHQVLTPLDYERIFALPHGHIHHAELSADQIFFRRPVRRYGGYNTPIAGLYQCGASAHPGGGVTGVPGHNAAQVVLKALGRH
jgi:phytoene dehydrogenase-like protein